MLKQCLEGNKSNNCLEKEKRSKVNNLYLSTLRSYIKMSKGKQEENPRAGNNEYENQKKKSNEINIDSLK